MLVERDIRQVARQGRDVRIEPFDPAMVSQNSMDVRLDSQYRVPDGVVTSIDTADMPTSYTTLVEVEPGDSIDLAPGDFIIGCTLEVVQLGQAMGAELLPKSGINRLGLMIAPGLVANGFYGKLSLEIYNVGPWTVRLHPGMPIAQLVFSATGRVGPRVYSGAYQNQLEPGESQI